MFQVPSFGNVYYTGIPYMGNTVDSLPYKVETVEEERKKTAKHGEMRWTPKQ